MSISFQERREGRVPSADSNLSGLRTNAGKPHAIKRWYNVGERGVQIRETYI